MNTTAHNDVRSHGPVKLVIGGGAVGFNWLPVVVADRQGLFAKRGLDVEIKRLGGIEKVTAAVKAGELDVGITPPEGAIRDCAAGGRLRIIAGNLNRLALSLIANPRIHRIEDLRGCKLGTSSLTEGTALYTIEMLSKHGLHYPGDYEFDVVGVHPARWKALQEGRIDAAVQLVPLNFVAVDAGYRNLGEVSDYIPEIVFTAIIANIDWAQGHREELVALLAAIMEGTRWILDPTHDDVSVAVMAELTQADTAYGRRSLDYMRDKGTFDVDLTVPAPALAKSIELMRDTAITQAAARAPGHFVLEDGFRVAAQERRAREALTERTQTAAGR